MKGVLTASVLSAALFLSACKEDPRNPVMSGQRIMIATINDWDREFITNTNRSVDAAVQISDTEFHVSGWYNTRMSGDKRLDYQMIVEKREFPVGTRYLHRCFVTLQEVSTGASPCF